MITIKDVHESLLNGQRRQMVNQIDQYGSDFWADYMYELRDLSYEQADQFRYFSDATISYFRIKNRGGYYV